LIQRASRGKATGVGGDEAGSVGGVIIGLGLGFSFRGYLRWRECD
jgi:hypothetical protein